MQLTIEALWIYPIKSCRGIAQDELTFDAVGPLWDRRWVLIDEHGEFLSQRRCPQMAKIATAIEGDELVVSADELTPLRVPLRLSQAVSPKELDIWGDQAWGLPVGEQADQWFSSVLGRPARLLAKAETPRVTSAAYAAPDGSTGQVGFADGFPLLLTNVASLQELNGRLEAPVPMSRFRPNIVVSGAPAFEEDTYQGLAAEDGRLWCVKPCSRCVMINVDQRSGQIDPAKEPLKTLSAYRSIKREDGKGQRVCFGQNLLIEGITRLAVGQRLEVLRR